MSAETRTVPAVPATPPAIRLEPAPPAVPGGTPRARALLSLGPAWKAPIDVTADLVGALAHSLWRARGGLDVDNWVEAERLLRSLVPSGLIEAKPAEPAANSVATPSPQAVAPAGAGLSKSSARRGKGR
ncbi:MAG: hypothetical protein JNM80_03125 [Phycisphaerae bacterium]|nr:hypothetical protein [Phycisphaerae bacterium]